MIQPIHPLLDAAYRVADATADNVSEVAKRLIASRATLDDLVAAVDVYRDANDELRRIQALRLSVNGRVYTLRGRSTGGADHV